ncbi:putative ribonuclease H-like domain-containing protein [Tanacetum coccineum]
MTRSNNKVTYSLQAKESIKVWDQQVVLDLVHFDLEVMEVETAQNNTTAKLPILKLENGNSWVSVPQTSQENGTSVTKMSVLVTAEEKINKKNDVKARSLLLMALPNEHQLTFSQYNDAKTSLPPEWNTHVVVWMNKADIETMSIDDLYNNFKIVEQEVKKSVGASTGTQNMAFMTTPSTSSTNDVNNANSACKVSTVSPNVNTASSSVSTANISDNAVYAFMVENPNGSNLLQQDLEQIQEDDLKAMDLKWQLSLLSMRAKRYYQRTGKKIFINANDTTGYDKSKVECFNCHKMGHFDRECRELRNKDDTSSKAMLAIDGVGYDWSDMAEEQIQTNMALMAFSDSELNETEFKVATYKRGLATVEEQLVTFRKNEVIFSEEIAVLKREVGFKDYEIGLDEFKEPEFNGYGPRDTGLKSTIDCDKESDNSKENTDDSLEKEQVSDNESSSVESLLKVDKETVNDWKETIFHAAKKVEFVKPKNNEKPVKKTVGYTEIYRSQSPRGNQRNWNGQKSNQLGSEFVMYNKACFIYGSFDHMKINCPHHQRKRMVTENNYNRGNPQLNDKGFVDSRCSRHMTSNIAYLSNFKEFEGGHVTFGGGAYGGRISSKGPRSVAGVRKNMCVYLKNQGGYKMKDFKGMSYDDIRPIFEKVWDQINSFVPMDSELEVQRLRESGLGSTSGIRACALRNFNLEVMEFETAQNDTTAKLPILKLGEYEMWEMRIKQYFQVQDYTLWEVIDNEKINKKNDVKARSLPLMALPNEHQLTFSQYSDAKTIYAAIKTRFGGNEATKKTQKALLKQQYENFIASSSESLDSIFNRLQKLVSRLVILGVVITPKNLNSKFLRSLPPEWNTHVVVWMNKDDIETMSIDDLYNNFKIVVQEVKKTIGASTGTQNMAFMTTPSTSSTNDVNTANSACKVSTVSPNVNTTSSFVSTANINDLEAMDLKWQLSLLSMRVKRYYQRTGKKIFINANDTAGYDKSKVECFNYHKMGHFARECRAPGTKMVSSDIKTTLGIKKAKKELAFSDSEVYNDKSYSKTCLKNYETLKKQCDDLIVKLNETEFKAATYKIGLAIVEDQLVTFRKNEVLFSEEIAVLKREVGCKDYEIGELLQSQITDRSKKGIGYNAISLPHPLIYNRPTKLDLSYSGLDEFKDPEFNGYGPRDTVLKSAINCDRESDNSKENTDDSLEKEQVSDNESSSVESPLKVDKETVIDWKETVFHTAKKIEFVKP